MPQKSLYVEVPAGFYTAPSRLSSPVGYQPTPEGVSALCAHYSKKYKINLRHLDLQHVLRESNSLQTAFKFLVKAKYLESLPEEALTGVVLTNGQKHAIPLLISKFGENIQLAVFDSTSGPTIRGYFQIAMLFPKVHFFLNSGTRQSDSFSCITDAICILKEALQIPGIFKLIHSKLIQVHPSLLPRKSRFIKLPTKPENFNLFHLPERLMLTAQRSKFVKELDPDFTTILRGGKSLKIFRQSYKFEAYIADNEKLVPKKINGYLFLKSKQHKELFDKIKASVCIATKEEIDKAKTVATIA